MYKRGDYHPDGSGRRLLGYQYRKTKDGRSEKKEWWVKPYRYESEIERIRIKNLNWKNTNRDHYRAWKREWVKKNVKKETARVREWRIKNPDKVKATHERAYKRNPARFKESTYKWRRNNRDKHLEYRKRWRKEKGDVELARTRKWRAENPEKVKESRRKTYYGNPDVRARMKAYAARRKSLLKDAFLKLSDVDQKNILRIYKMAELISEHTGVIHHVDHWHPLAKGGQHHPDNLVIVKAEENLKKKAILTDNLPAEFFSHILLPEGFFQMDWIWRGGRRPRAKKVNIPPPTPS